MGRRVRRVASAESNLGAVAQICERIDSPETPGPDISAPLAKSVEHLPGYVNLSHLHAERIDRTIGKIIDYGLDPTRRRPCT